MKKYLISGMAAIVFCGVFTSCSHDLDNGGDSTKSTVEETYEKAFITHFGEPAQDRTWGFGSSAKALTRGHNPNANEWADPTKEYGGWVVPDPLEEGQKLRVQKYFQYNYNPGGTECNYEDFFVQQVYKGNPQTKGPYSDEQYQSANEGWVVGSDHMDHLTAGSIHDHINNFNYGTYSGGSTVSVLKNGEHVGGATQEDQIMLMVNSQTDCFGYWNSDGSLGHDDRYRLVSAKTIDDWIDQHADLGFGPDYGVRVQDDWKRSFIGFDFDQVVGIDVFDKINQVWEDNKLKSYDIHYAKYSDATESPQYVWDGDNVLPIATQTSDLDITDKFTGFWNGGNQSTDPNEDGSITYHATVGGGWNAWFGQSFDFSPYSSVVVEFAEPTTVSTTLFFQLTWNSFEQTAEAGVNQIELNFAENQIDAGNLQWNVNQIAIQAAEESDLIINKIYLKGSAGGESVGEYMIYNNKQVPYLISDQNTYCGLFYEYSNGKDLLIQKNYNGSQVNCINMPKIIEERLSKDYLPVAGSEMKKWVKVQGGADGYYSDWIVTICEAENVNKKSDDDAIVVIAEDLTIDDARPDFDFNDVVFQVNWNKTENTVTVDVLAAGGTLPLYIGGTAGTYTDGNEVHAEFARVNPSKVITTGTMVNTYEGKHSEYTTPSFEVTNFNHSATTIEEVAGSIVVAVKKFGEFIELTAPQGGVPAKIAVKTDFLDYGWCDERQDIDDRFNKDGKPLFKSYVKGELDDDWYREINPKKYQ